MGNTYFSFRQFTVHQDRCAMKVTTDACLFGAWTASFSQKPGHTLDIGAGTGLLSLMLIQRHRSPVDCVEIDPAAFEQLKNNIGSSPWHGEIHPYLGDIQEFQAPHKYDLIISNPPFHENQLTAENDQTNWARHGDKLTLSGLFSTVVRLLSINGNFFLLLPFYRKEEALEMAQQHGLFPQFMTDVKQTHEHKPFRVMFGFTHSIHPLVTQEIVIRDAHGNYTQEFSQLLGEYYINL